MHRPQLKRNSFIDNLEPEIAAVLEHMRLTEDPKEPPAGVRKKTEQQKKTPQKQNRAKAQQNRQKQKGKAKKKGKFS